MIVALSLSSCSKGTAFDINTPEGREALMDQVRKHLTAGECVVAINLIEPLYDSQYSNSEVRLLRAAAHGCRAGIDFLPLLTQLVGGSLTGSDFYKTLTRIFPSEEDDQKMESAWFATDALMATLKVGTVLDDLFKVNGTTRNPGSMRYWDRSTDSNMYIIFVGMAAMGTTQNRFGEPNSSYVKTVDLPWETHDEMDETGCAYAGSLVNLLDGIDGVIDGLGTSSFANTLRTIQSDLGGAITAACTDGCDDVFDVDTLCDAATTTCSGCPLKIRNRNTCMSNTVARCAAAGVVRAVNFTWN